MAPNKTNHPPRKGIEIEKHKGGRTARLNARFTEAEKSAIMAATHTAGLSVSDFILTHPALAQLTQRPPDKSGLALPHRILFNSKSYPPQTGNANRLGVALLFR